MSIAVLVQVHEEVRRLAIAGAAVAGGDFRLKKLVAPLEQAGAKAPIFARVAMATRAVVESDEKAASQALLELASLVNAILYTQGETGIDGEFEALETTDLGAHETQASARVLKPLLDALSSNGSGRLELVRDAVERGTFRDLRLVRASLRALDDPYPEIAALIRTKVLPMFGKAIVPELRATLDIKGRAGHVHRLQLLHRLDPDGTCDTVRRALDEGSKEMRVAAVECLGTSGEDLELLLEQVRSRAKDVRAAALRALAGAGNHAPEIVDAIRRAIDGADLESIVGHLSACTLPGVQDYVIARAEEQLTRTLAEKDTKKQGVAIERLTHLVVAIQDRVDAKVEALLVRCFENVGDIRRIKSIPSGEGFNEMLAHVMSRATPRLRRMLAAAHATLPGPMLAPAYDAARETMTPAAFFEVFGPLLARLKPPRARKGGNLEPAEALESILTGRAGVHFLSCYFRGEPVEPGAAECPPKRELDPRWLDAAVDSGAVELVCALARPGHAKANAFLRAQLERTKPEDRDYLLRAMVRVGHPEAADAIIETLERQAKASHHGYYRCYWYGEVIAALPRKEHARFEALLPTLPEKMVDDLIESVTQLKNKPE